MDIKQLLYLLSDGEFHSGSELGVALGLSRTSIWKTLPQLEKLSIEIETIKGKGYRIPGGLDLLDKEEILSSLPLYVNSLLQLDILLSHESTNDYLLTFAKQGFSSQYQACISEKQLAGRGRRGRAWVSPFAKNIYLSLGFSMDAGVEQLSGLSLVVGIAVAKTLENLGVNDVGLKWPNDVYVEGKKIAGILLELNGEATTGWNVICGVGLNVLMDKKEGNEISQDWIALKDIMQCKRNVVATELIKQLIEVLEQFKSGSFSDFVLQWDAYDILKGRNVQVSPSNLVGRVTGINKQGALLVNDGIEHVVNAGEVSVRKI